MQRRVLFALSFIVMVTAIAYNAIATPFGQYPGAYGIMGGVQKIGVGGATVTPTWPLEVGGTWTSVSGVGDGVSIYPTLKASANNDVLTGVLVNPTYTLGSFTGVVQVGLAVAAGNTGLGTTSPGAKLDVSGHVANSGSAATIGTCGMSPSISGNDTRGAGTTGTGTVTSCVVTFASAYVSAPFCTATWAGTGAPTTGVSVATTTSALTVYFSASSPSAVFNYNCMQ